MRRCGKFLAAHDGKLSIPAADSADGKSIFIMARMSRWALAGSWPVRAGPRLSMRIPKGESVSEVSSFTIRLNFHGDLAFFLKSKAGNKIVERRLGEKTSVKDVIESCGVPHPEIDLILLNGASVPFDRPVQDADRIAVFPRFQTIDVSDVTRVRPRPLATVHSRERGRGPPAEPTAR